MADIDRLRHQENLQVVGIIVYKVDLVPKLTGTLCQPYCSFYCCVCNFQIPSHWHNALRLPVDVVCFM